MSRILALVAAALMFCASATASVFAAPVDTLIHSGKCQTGSNWSLGFPPSPYDVLIPAGKILKVEGKACAMRSLDVEAGGEVLGAGGTLEVGNSLRAEGPAGTDIALTNDGHIGVQSLHLTGSYLGAPQILDFGAAEPSVWSLYIEGPAHYQLGEAAHFQTAWQMGEGTYFDTAGYFIGGMGWTLAGLPGITLKLHGSEWDTGEWRVSHEVGLEAQSATVYEDDGSYGIFEGHGQSFGRVIVMNHRPHVIESFSTGTLEERQTADGTPIVYAGLFLPNERPEGTVSLEAFSTNGTEANPVVQEGKVTFSIPHDVTVTGGCINLSEVTVVGGILHVPCGTEGPSDSNVSYP